MQPQVLGKGSSFSNLGPPKMPQEISSGTWPKWPQTPGSSCLSEKELADRACGSQYQSHRAEDYCNSITVHAPPEY